MRQLLCEQNKHNSVSESSEFALDIIMLLSLSCYLPLGCRSPPPEDAISQEQGVLSIIEIKDVFKR